MVGDEGRHKIGHSSLGQKRLIETIHTRYHWRALRLNSGRNLGDPFWQCSFSDTNGPSLKINDSSGEQFLHYGLTDRSLRSDIALIVGDAIHNLKSALDIAYRETIRVLSPNGFTAKTKFIVGNNRRHLESSLTKTAKIGPHSPLFDFLVERVKSYKGGDSDIYALHKLDIDDKHHLLIPMLAVVGVDGVELEHENGTINRFTIMLVRPVFYRTRVARNSKIKEPR